MLYSSSFFFFFNDTATTEIYTLSLHDALPILADGCFVIAGIKRFSDRIRLLPLLRGWVEIRAVKAAITLVAIHIQGRSEEHTSELQSQSNLVCRLLLEKKKKKTQNTRVIY